MPSLSSITKDRAKCGCSIRTLSPLGSSHIEYRHHAACRKRLHVAAAPRDWQLNPKRYISVSRRSCERPVVARAYARRGPRQPS